MATPSFVPMFRLTFILGTTNTITLSDLVQSYLGGSSPTTAIFSLTDPDGLIFYQNAGYNTDSFLTPDFNSASSTWSVAGITPYLDANGISVKRGTYTVSAKYKCGSVTTTVIKTYDLQYVSPTVDISLSASCRTSELTVTDNTDYSFIGETIPITSTISRVETTTKPAGSSANAPGSTTTTTTSHSRTIGGGVTAATRLWTRVWQTNVVTTMQFDMATWGNYNWIVIQDTVYGDDSIDVKCTDCACVLNTCWENLIARWKESEANYALNVHDLRYKIALGAALWTDFYNLERCGEDTTYKCIEIRDLLNSTDCSCIGEDDTKSHVIVPWGAGSSLSAASTFAFTFSATDPTDGSGSSGGVHFNTATQCIWNNASGTWINNGSLSGTAGTPGASATPSSLFYNNSANVGTSAGVTLELLDKILLASPIAYATGDCIYVKALFELAQNDNGKTCSLYINATKISEYFTDTTINSTNNILLMEMCINCTGSDQQAVETKITRGGNVFPGFSTQGFDTSAGLTINAYAQNSVATMNDIICRMLTVEVKNKI